MVQPVILITIEEMGKLRHLNFLPTVTRLLSEGANIQTHTVSKGCQRRITVLDKGLGSLKQE